MRRAMLWLLAIGLLLPLIMALGDRALAHLTPNSELILDFREDSVVIDAIIPEGDYRLASGAAAGLTVSRFDPGSGWSDLPASGLASSGFQIATDALGNVWALGATQIARYDSTANTWSGPKNFDFTPADAQQSNGDWPLSLATDSRGNAWAVGVRRKAAGQDLPVLWINRFSISTGKWDQAGSLSVQGGDNASFVQPAQGNGSTFQVALSVDSQDRPVAAVTEMIQSGSSGYQARAWIARGQAA